MSERKQGPFRLFLKIRSDFSWYTRLSLILFSCTLLNFLFLTLSIIYNSPYTLSIGDGGNSTSSATLSGPLTPEQTQQLIEQNAQLRNRLKEFNLALDRALRSSQSNVAASAKSAGNARIYQAVQDQELANVHKRMDILRKENEVRQ